MRVFVALNAGEQQTQADSRHQPLLENLAVIIEQAVVRPCQGRARGEQDQGVKERQLPGA